MKITTDIKSDFLDNTKLIEQVEVVYKKKKRYHGALSGVPNDPFEVKILDKENKDDDPEHIIDFDLAEQITITFLNGQVKTYQDEVA